MISNGHAVAYGAIAFIGAVVLWRYKKGHRRSAFLFAIAAVFLAVGIAPWRDALASLITSGWGFTVLIAVDIVSGVGFWYEAVRKHMHHRIRTPVLMLAFGTSLVLTIGSGARLLAEASRSPGQSSAAIGQAITQIRSGHAAAAVPSHRALEILAGAVIGLALLIVAAHHMEKTSSKSSGPSGFRPGGAKPSARPSITSGKRR